MPDQFQRHLCGVPCVQSFHCGEVEIGIGGDTLVLQGIVYHPSLVVLALILLVFLEEAFLLPSWIPCWDGCCSFRVRRAIEGSVGDASVLIGQKDESKVAVLTSTEVDLD